MKKYLIRVIGALCILGAVALMFMPAWVKLDGVKKSELRDVREDITGALGEVSDYIQYRLDDDDFKDDLKDNDLPYKTKTVKKQYKDMDNLCKSVLDGDISMQELLTLSAKIPGVVTDLENILELEAADSIFYQAARYIVRYGNDPMINPGEVDYYNAGVVARTAVEDLTNDAEMVPLICYGLTAVLVLVLALGVLGAVLHVCNKGRWVKYLFFALLLALVVGSLLAFPMVNEALGETAFLSKDMQDLELKMTVTPILAVALMFVPIVLDISFERKFKKMKMEA